MESALYAMATTWTFGSEGSALWFTISIDDSGLASVEMLAGSMDLNALWFSDGDTTKNEGSTTLTKTQTSLNMNGSGSLDAEGNLIAWDQVSVLSNSGLGKLGTTKTTYLTAGEEQTFTLDPGTLAFLDSFKEESEGSEGGTYDFSSLVLGVRATSVNGGDSVKLNAVADVDDTAPVVSGDQSFNYAENQIAGAEVGQVQATDNVAVTQFRFADTAGTTSADGYYQIDSTGKITITAEGVAAGVANNDYEITPNDFTYGIEAGDAADNWSAAVDVTLNVTDLDDSGGAGGGGSAKFISVDNKGNGEIRPPLRAWYDTDQDGVFDNGETVISVTKSQDYAADSFGTFNTYSLDGVDFTNDEVTIQLWQLDQGALDLSGFTSDDKLKIDFTAITDARASIPGSTQFTLTRFRFSNGVLSRGSVGYSVDNAGALVPTYTQFVADLSSTNFLPGMAIGVSRASWANALAVLAYSSNDAAISPVKLAQVDVTWPN